MSLRKNVKVWSRRMGLMFTDADYEKICAREGMNPTSRSAAVFIAAYNYITKNHRDEVPAERRSAVAALIGHAAADVMYRDCNSVVAAVGARSSTTTMSYTGLAVDIVNAFIAARTDDHSRPSVANFVLAKVR